jgi:uncharacterized SAM-binding protein YcdF (DUF218 family)
MFFIISKIFEYVGSPSHIALLLLALGVALGRTRWSKSARRLTTLSVILLALIILGPLGHFLATPLETRFPALPDDIAPPDGIIVLGGSVDEALSAERRRISFTDAAERLTAPIELLRRFPRAKLVFSGGSAALNGSTATEAEAVKRFWRAVGIDQGEAIYEDRSRNTYENAVFTRDLIKPKPGERWLLVTSAMHMPRAVGIFRQVGFPIVPYPVDFRTNGRFLSLGLVKYSAQGVAVADLASHEWIGLLVYRVTGRSDALFPAP